MGWMRCHLATTTLLECFSLADERQLYYLEASRLSMIPKIQAVIPKPVTMKPSIVHLGLLYINEEDGPTKDLLCNVNIIPRIINMIPTIYDDLPIFFRSMKHMRPDAQKTFSS